MKRPITLPPLFLTLLFGGLAIFAVPRIHAFAAGPVLIPSPEAVPNSYFGMTLHNYNKTTPWPSIPFASLRTWDTAVTWDNIQPTPNTFAWSNLDALIDLAQSRRVDLVFTLGRTPRWASASPNVKNAHGPGQCAPPANMDFWDGFLRAVVSHVGGKIKFWETWNEPQSPDSMFYCGDVSTMVELQRRLYDVIKASVPGAMVLTPSTVGGYGPAWMGRFLAGGGGKYADIMNFHGYLAPGADAESIVDTITKFKAIFAEHGQETKPVWDTEAGWGENSWLSDPDMQAAFLAKFYLLHWSAGVERFYWYAYDNNKWGTLWDAEHGLHQAGIAYREVHKWLDDATMTTPCVLDRRVWTCNLIRKNGYRAIVLWDSPKERTHATHISVPDGFRQYRDLDGNLQSVAADGVPISGKPILVETVTAF
jgi:polysaccharide biosynthesis protein PslG